MMKAIYIFCLVFAVLSCNKDVISPTVSNSTGNLDNDIEQYESTDLVYDINHSVQKDVEGDVIIDPNGRDDVGDKKDKKAK